MKTTLSALIITICWTVAALAETPVAAGEVTGTWTRANSPYMVQGDIQVPRDGMLRIEPGVEVRFSGFYGLTVHGRLEVGVTPKRLRLPRNERQPVLFTNEDGSGWAGLQIMEAEKCDIANAVFDNARSLGDKPDGGALYIYRSDVSLANVNINESQAEGSGGAIACIGSNLSLANCNLSDNSATVQGGGLYASSSAVSMANCNVSDCVGGGIACVDKSSLSMANCNITDNTGNDEAFGVFLTRSSLSAANLVVSDNSRGGLLFRESSGSMVNASISDNTGVELGAGILCRASELSLTNVSLSDNSSGLGCYDRSTAVLTNVSLSGKRALDRDAESKVTMINSHAE